MAQLDDLLRGLDFPLNAWIIYAVHRDASSGTAISDVKMVHGWDNLRRLDIDNIEDPAPHTIEDRSSNNVFRKANVLRALADGNRVFTAFLTDDQWERGEEVQSFADQYLRTDANAIREDNLGELPEF